MIRRFDFPGYSAFISGDRCVNKIHIYILKDRL